MEHKELYVKLDDNKSYHLHYTDWGISEKTLLCVHGLTRNCRDFDYLAKELSEQHGYRVISINMFGRGRSEYLPDSTMYNYENYCLAVLSLLETLQLTSIDYIGSSMGGILAMHLARNKPHLFNKLILNDIGTFIPKASLAKIARYVVIYPKFKDLDHAKLYLKTKLAYFGIKSEENWDYITKHSVTYNKDRELVLDYDLKVTESMLTFNTQDISDIDFGHLWPGLHCNKLLILRGKKSEIFLHENAIQMMEGKKNTTLIEFENTGHTPALMEEGQLKQVVDWLLSN